MSTSKSFQNQQGFTSYRPTSPKLTSNSPTAITSNLSGGQAQSFMNMQRGKQNSHFDTDHFATIRQQNSLLREQNKALKREIHLIKGQFLSNNSLTFTPQNHQVNDLRQTIKKEAGEIKQLKTRLQVVSKQSKMYEQIIDKMEGKINKLTEQNKNLEQKLKDFKNLQKLEKEQKSEELFRHPKQKFNQLADKCSQIMNLYIQLQSRVQLSQKEWQMWKQQWAKQKSYYLHRIQNLESLLGIGVQSKEFYKKRF